MPKPKKRDNAYWLPRLRAEHPHVYDRLIARKLASVREACIEAGLIRQPTRLDALKRVWRRASASERLKFLDFAVRGAPAGGPIVGLTDKEGFLTPSAVKLIEGLMKARRMPSGDVMKELGYKKLDPTLGNVLARRWKPSESLLKDLEGFLLPRHF